MEEILKAFSVGFLLRSVLAGGFFLAALLVGRSTPETVKDITLENIPLALLVSVFAGVTTYSIHRCLLFPVVEWVFNAGWAKGLRAWGLSLISDSTVNSILRNWGMGESREKAFLEYRKHITIWADYTHFQYAAALCIVFGSALGDHLTTDPSVCYPPLFWLTLILFVGALVSDWRLHSVEDAIDVRWPEMN